MDLQMIYTIISQYVALVSLPWQDIFLGSLFNINI
jgi:hypothetical protein